MNTRRLGALLSALVVLFVLLAVGGCSKPPRHPAYLPGEFADPPVAQQTETPYVLGTGDKLSISVWRQSDMDRSVTVDPSGDIVFPFAGRVRVAGLTAAEVEEILTARLGEYYVDPVVDVGLSEAGSRRIYVLGEVNEPGAQVLDRPTSALEAMAAAAGFNEDANREYVLLVRRDQGETQVRALDFRLGNPENPGHLLTAQLALRNHDVIYAVPTRIANVERFMIRLENILKPILSVERGLVTWPDAWNVLKTGTIEDSGSTRTVIFQ